jgi:hypothetical protein
MGTPQWSCYAVYRYPPLSSNQIFPPCLPVGATALGEPWSPLEPVFTGRFLNKIIFYRMGLLVPFPTPTLEDQGVSLSLYSTFWPYRHGWPCCSLNYRRHCSSGRRVAQAPPPRQGADTYGENSSTRCSTIFLSQSQQDAMVDKHLLLSNALERIFRRSYEPLYIESFIH